MYFSKQKNMSFWIFLPIAIYLSMTFYQINKPGPHYDEFIFLIDSLKLAGKEEIFPLRSEYLNIEIGAQKLPIMWVTGYLGPGKTYFFAAIFKLFSPVVSTVRYTTSIVGFFSLLLTYFFVKRLFNRSTAFLTLVLLSTDLSYIFLNRNDHGPVAMMMFCKIAALLLLLIWWQERKIWSLLLGMFLLGFGLLGKATFAQFIVSFIISSVFLLRKELWKRLLSFQLIPAILCFLVGAAPFIYYHLNHPASLFNFWISKANNLMSLYHLSNIERVIRLALVTFNGTFEQRFILGRVLIKLWVPYLLGGTCLIYLIMIIGGKGPRILVSKKINFIIIISLLLLVMMVFTPQVRSSWHFVMVYPFPYIFCSVVFISVLLLKVTKKRFLLWLWRGTIITLIGLVLVINVKGLLLFHREIREGRVNFLWSEKIYNLADYLRQNPRKVAICMDWGFYSNLAFLLKGEVYLKNKFNLIAQKGGRHRKLHKYFRFPNSLFIFHPPNLTLFKGTRRLFEESLERYNYTADKVKSFYDGKGKEIYCIFEVRPAS